MRIEFLSERQARHLTGGPTSAIISICDPERACLATDKPWWKVRGVPTFDGWRHKLQLFFHDVDPTESEIPPHYECFTIEQAEEVIAFLVGLPREIDRLIIHCAAGISRSAAVAKFAGDFYIERGVPVETNLTGDYDRFNRHVYTTLWSAWNAHDDERDAALNTRPST